MNGSVLNVSTAKGAIGATVCAVAASCVLQVVRTQEDLLSVLSSAAAIIVAVMTAAWSVRLGDIVYSLLLAMIPTLLLTSVVGVAMGKYAALCSIVILLVCVCVRLFTATAEDVPARTIILAFGVPLLCVIASSVVTWTSDVTMRPSAIIITLGALGVLAHVFLFSSRVTQPIHGVTPYAPLVALGAFTFVRWVHIHAIITPNIALTIAMSYLALTLGCLSVPHALVARISSSLLPTLICMWLVISLTNQEGAPNLTGPSIQADRTVPTSLRNPTTSNFSTQTRCKGKGALCEAAMRNKCKFSYCIDAHARPVKLNHGAGQESQTARACREHMSRLKTAQTATRKTAAQQYCIEFHSHDSCEGVCGKPHRRSKSSSMMTRTLLDDSVFLEHTDDDFAAELRRATRPSS